MCMVRVVCNSRKLNGMQYWLLIILVTDNWWETKTEVLVGIHWIWYVSFLTGNLR